MLSLHQSGHKDKLMANWEKMENTEFLHVIAAEYISGYLLKLTFSNVDVRTFDFSSIYNKGIFTKLQNPEYFRNYTLDGWTVDWNNEIGFAPEYLYEQGAPVENK